MAGIRRDKHYRLQGSVIAILGAVQGVCLSIAREG